MDVKMGNYYQKYLIAFLSKRYQENVKILINNISNLFLLVHKETVANIMLFMFLFINKELLV